FVSLIEPVACENNIQRELDINVWNIVNHAAAVHNLGRFGDDSELTTKTYADKVFLKNGTLLLLAEVKSPWVIDMDDLITSYNNANEDLTDESEENQRATSTMNTIK